ncbi:Protein CBR-CHK-1 [Caenorhabditis briggsae]|uniref:Serine/threonine-protein kinase chk-1 n=2 Tax=Caenorhabditis briggsae TaxID=6238 RepID=CHK1_CAEBR|nr:Protein CBR-CHK-1 [Caenorhabditis briggsae]Q61RA2.1 RecName: Full=Serine/threonine-protein kinase chk-1 [Caenorhabditis briggsae]ULT88227.1 hypothetical protein L3Y34_007432 [Caenorhabditis briggsae]UMM34030.1 hypothetical protein L5515_007280 [Caenorhabditis briggsae]CAP26947.1 Protein CBR-CHK-1 [Caenorhabditis briggsae]
MSADVSTKPRGSLPIPTAPGESNECYRVIRTLGEGAFGEVLLIVNNKNPDMAVAMKKMQITTQANTNNIRKEFLIQQKLSKVGHDNFIRAIGMRTENGFHFLFLEYADGGELFDKIEPDHGMPTAIAQFYFRQLIEGLKYIHDCDIVHRDIKPENLLLTTSHVLKISDFGMATLYRNEGKERLLDLSCGTIPYAAPEVCAGGKYRGPPIDVWSSGIVLIAMLTGELPWDRASDSSYAYLQWLGNNNLDENPWRKMDVRALCMLRRILTDNVHRRATIEQIKTDPWFTHNYGKLEMTYGRPLKRARYADENSPDCNISSTQQADAVSTAKRRHLETPDKVAHVERQNASFSQPTRTEDLLLTQNIDMSQNNTNLLERMVCRMTRFCTKFDVPTSYRQLIHASEHAGYEVRQTADNRLLVTFREVSMMVTLYSLKTESRVMVDFRRSRGDGIQFKKMFLEVRNRMNDSICVDGQNFLEDCGYVPRKPQFVREANA